MKPRMIGALAAGCLAASLAGVTIALNTQQSSDRPVAENQEPASPSISPDATPEPDPSEAPPEPPAVTEPPPESQAAAEAPPEPNINDIAAAPPAAGSELFTEAIAEAKQQTTVPMLLPSELPSTVTQEPIYITTVSDADRYDLTLGLVENCTASACAVGTLSGERGGDAYPGEFSQTVALTQGIEGYFQPMSCGASCAPPVIAWSYDDVFYRIYLKVPGSDTEAQAALVSIANSAIAAGPR